MRKLIVTFAITMIASQAWAGDAAVGKVKYDMMCAGCHGAAGMGDGPAGAAMNPKPRDLTDKTWLATRKDDELRTVINKGGTALGLSPMMPGMGAGMTPAEVDGIIAYIRSIAK